MALASLAAATSPVKPPVAGAKEAFCDPYGNTVAVGTQPRPAPPHRRPSNAVAQRLNERPDGKPPGPGEHQRPARNIGIHYWIELVEPERPMGVRVTADRTFRSGDRIRVHFRSNVPGHIALLQLGASGSSSVLFPDASKGHADGRLEALQDRVLPSDSAWFRFDDQVGIERILVLFAQQQEELPLLVTASAVGRPSSQLVEATVEHARSSKDLVLETEVQAIETIGTYVVNVDGGPVIFELLLRHS